MWAATTKPTSFASTASRAKAASATFWSRTTVTCCPRRVREELSYASKDVSDHTHAELSPEEVNRIFHENYVNHEGRIELMDFHFTHAENNKAFKAFVTVKIDGDEQDVIGNGNGRLDSVCNAMEKLGLKAHIASYSEHAMTGGFDSSAMAYVGVEDPDGKIVWGAGEHQRHYYRIHQGPHFRPEPHVAPFGAGTCSPGPMLRGERASSESTLQTPRGVCTAPQHSFTYCH